MKLNYSFARATFVVAAAGKSAASLVWITILASALVVSAKSPDINVTLEPQQIALGQAAQLTVTVEGQSRFKPEIPPVSGLTFEPVGQSSQIQVINGAMTANISHTYAVVPSREGTFTIPRIKVGSGADASESQAMTLKVAKRGNTPATRASQGFSGRGTLPAPNISAGDAGGPAPADPNSLGFLRIVAPKKEFFVGEMVPVELKAYFREGVQLRVDGLPRLNSDSFTMNPLGDKPVGARQLIGGVPYTVLTWPTAITAVKAGDYELSVEIPTTVTVRQAGRARGGSPFGDSFFDDMFNDPFFNSFFGAATQKQVVLGSEPDAVQILTLPTENRPETFSGAVGKFDLTATATPARVAAGDPVTLKMLVSGAGNFDRVSAPAIEAGNDWKAYQASASFTPADSAGLSGEKMFTQALVPTKSGEMEIPALEFSYFDPDNREYVTRTTPPIVVEVLAAQLAPAVAATPIAPETPSAAESTPVHNVVSRSGAFNVWLVATVGLLLVSAAFGLGFWLRRPRDSRSIATAEATPTRAPAPASQTGRTLPPLPPLRSSRATGHASR